MRPGVAASTQSQALNAVLFLYRDVLGIEVQHLTGLRRVQRVARLPVVMTVTEVRDVLARMHGTPRLAAELLYGAGLRVTECMTLRVKDLDFRAGTVHVRCWSGCTSRSGRRNLKTTMIYTHIDQAIRRTVSPLDRL